jgi:soluble lytic murein transglycosylase-like protein
MAINGQSDRREKAMTTDEIKALVIQTANQYGINSNIALVQIQRESGFNPNAVGSSGERGLAQFMPGTWERFGSGSFDNAFDPETNLNAWGAYMNYLSTLFGGDYSYMLTAYNGGEGHLLDPGKYGPPSQAARRYAQEILASANVDPNNIGPIVVEPGSIGGFPLWLLLGAAGLVLFFALSD